MSGKEPLGSFSWTVGDVVWGVLVEPIELASGRLSARSSSLARARLVRAGALLVKAFGGLLSHVATLATREGACCTSGDSTNW